MTELKPCPKYHSDFWKCRCHIQIIKTIEPEPNNIRMVCKTHEYVMPGSYSSVENAEESWKRRAEDG